MLQRGRLGHTQRRRRTPNAPADWTVKPQQKPPWPSEEGVSAGRNRRMRRSGCSPLPSALFLLSAAPALASGPPSRGPRRQFPPPLDDIVKRSKGKDARAVGQALTDAPFRPRRQRRTGLCRGPRRGRPLRQASGPRRNAPEVAERDRGRLRASPPRTGNPARNPRLIPVLHLRGRSDREGCPRAASVRPDRSRDGPVPRRFRGLRRTPGRPRRPRASSSRRRPGRGSGGGSRRRSRWPRGPGRPPRARA